MPGAPVHASRGGSRALTLRLLAGGFLLLAATLAFAAVYLLTSSTDAPPRPALASPSPAPTGTLGIAAIIDPTPTPTAPPQPTLPPLRWERPTAAPGEIQAALALPVAGAGGAPAIARMLDPLTILPNRPRAEVITYSVQPGDNLRDIAARFGLQENTIIWSNDRFYVNAMRIGLELTILPVDGVYHRVQGPQTIAEIAGLYDVDPYAIIDSEFNPLFGLTPETLLPEGLYVVVPGGTGSTEPIYWDPGIVMTTRSGSGATAGASSASFAVGDPGSCGTQAVVGGTLPVGAPIFRSYRITQDYSWNHGGIDLAVPEGTPVYAAGGGTVIFKGWSTWGYGYTVVIAHGGTLSLYGHLNGAFVSCGAVVTQGQNIAVSGNSGNSSGPHLHFEIRGSNGAPVNPWDYQRF